MSDFERITLVLDREEAAALYQAARVALRRPRDHARYLLRLALCPVEPANPPLPASALDELRTIIEYNDPSSEDAFYIDVLRWLHRHEEQP